MIDPISDLLIQIKNGYLARLKEINLSHSKNKEALAKLLARKNLVGKVEISKDAKSKPQLKIELLYSNKKPKFTEVLRVSKPSRRVYVSKSEIPRVVGGRGISVISTPQGLMSDDEARKKGIGGELICKIW